MAQQTIVLTCTQSAMVDRNNPTRNYHGETEYRIFGISSSNTVIYSDLVLGFSGFPDAYSRNRLISALINLKMNRSISASYTPNLQIIGCESFDESVITYNDQPELTGERESVSSTPPAGSGQYTFSHAFGSSSSSPVTPKKLLDSLGIKLHFSGIPDSGNYVDVYTKLASSALRPTISIVYDDSDIIGSQIEISNAPTSGYINPRYAVDFAWSYSILEPLSCAADEVIQNSAIFYWREGNSGSYNSITISGSGQSLTIPANTFPVGSSIQYYISGTDTVGSVSSTPVYTLSTSAGAITALPIAPIGSVEDASAPITLSWEYYSNDGYPQDGADIQVSADGSTWSDLGSVDSDTTNYSAPVGTFNAGAAYWRVRGYNIDGAAGAWSEAASFIAVAAPPSPSVTAIPKPFTVVSWQSSGQQAYRITIDGVTYGPFFGTVKSYTPKDYLRDGIHTISVEIQGVYGLWSQAGSVTFTIANSPGDGITLSGSFDRDAALSWTTTSTTADFLVYRDDKQIAATSVTGYTDRFVLDAHSYQVINRLPDGNYTASNIVNGVMRSCTTAIAPFNGGAWQELKLSENSYSEQRFSWAKLSSTRHVTGAVYPVIEVSEYEDAAGSYDVSFPDVESANAFLALRGHIVILKSRGGNVVIGALTQIEQANKDFYISFAFTIQRIDWEDYVDAQNS